MLPLLLTASLSGNWLLGQCEGNTVERAFCNGFIFGAASASQRSGEKAFCLQAIIRTDDMRAAVVKRLQNDPFLRELAATDALILALKSAYPCKGK